MKDVRRWRRFYRHLLAKIVNVNILCSTVPVGQQSSADKSVKLVSGQQCGRFIGSFNSELTTTHP